MNPKDISCCLISKDPIYPKVLLDYIQTVGFGEILILTHSDSPSRKQELFAKAKHDYIFYCDDDCIPPVYELLELSKPDIINVAMKQGHFNAYYGNLGTMGLGWGAIFPKKLLASMKKYTDIYGEDEVYKREDTRIFTYLNYPQNRLILPITDLPSASDGTRLWQQPKHWDYKAIAEERCRGII